MMWGPTKPIKTVIKAVTESVTVYKIDNVTYRIISLDNGIVIKTAIKCQQAIKGKPYNGILK